jgi:UDP-N-acetylglucosamine 2-epimerase (non-hydrolysing)
MKRIAVVYGTRPEAIKLAPLIQLIQVTPGLECLTICTGQHREMLEGIFEIWQLRNNFVLEPEFGDKNVSSLPPMMEKLEKILRNEKPDFLIVQGDTTSATAGALVAHGLKIPVGHVEAGLRSGDIWNPWPEEANRRIIDSISTLHFAPTRKSAQNLNSENCFQSVVITGNTIVDALTFVLSILDSEEINNKLETIVGIPMSTPFILFTQHRREAFGVGQEKIYAAILALADLGHEIVFPVHMNPAVRDFAHKILDNHPRIHLIEPLSYLYFIGLIRSARILISDSGGLQEEAPTFKKKILITRLTTERPEILESGFGELVGYETDNIVEAALLGMNEGSLSAPNPFGDGEASSRIVMALNLFLEQNQGKP